MGKNMCKPKVGKAVLTKCNPGNTDRNVKNADIHMQNFILSSEAQWLNKFICDKSL